MNYDDLDWEPPSEADQKLIAARRERSDQISKLMSGYLLKGYKMLGSVCTKCDTILLQDRQGTNYCVACSELNSDTDKDNPAINESAAISMARELEIASAAAASMSPPAGRNSVSRVSPSLQAPAAPHFAHQQESTTSQSTASASSKLPSTHDESSRIEVKPKMSPREDLLVNPNLSISSIDVQSFTTNVISSSVKDQTYSKYNSISTASKQLTDEVGSADSGFYSTKVNDKRSSEVGGDAALFASTSDSVHVSRLQDKISWASQELQSTHSIEYSIHLSQLIKIASEAIVSLRNARM